MSLVLESLGVSGGGSVKCLCIDWLVSVYIISLEKFPVVGGGCFCDYSFSSGPLETGIETSLRE